MMIITSEILLSRKSPHKLASQVSCGDSRMQVVRFPLWTAAVKIVSALLSSEFKNGCHDNNLRMVIMAMRRKQLKSWHAFD